MQTDIKIQRSSAGKNKSKRPLNLIKAIRNVYYSELIDSKRKKKSFYFLRI